MIDALSHREKADIKAIIGYKNRYFGGLCSSATTASDLLALRDSVVVVALLLARL
jgi:hypothetical protein